MRVVRLPVVLFELDKLFKFAVSCVDKYERTNAFDDRISWKKIDFVVDQCSLERSFVDQGCSRKGAPSQYHDQVKGFPFVLIVVALHSLLQVFLHLFIVAKRGYCLHLLSVMSLIRRFFYGMLFLSAREAPGDRKAVPTMTVNTPTRPTLLEINSTGPVRVRRLGAGHEGLVWTVDPENFGTVVDMVNAHGGPDFWEIIKI